MGKERYLHLLGNKINRLRVLSIHSSKETGKPGIQLYCECECGNSKYIRADRVLSEHTKSCGCLKLQRARENCQIGLESRRHGGSGTPEYEAWASMRKRCLNEKHKFYYRYGGRGITICPKWEDFKVFLKDMGERPSDKHSLDRIDNCLLYTSPSPRDQRGSRMPSSA